MARFRSAVLLLATLAATAAERRTVRFGSFPFTYPPWFEVDPDSGEYVGGFLFDIFTQLGIAGGYDIEFVPIVEPG
jgi:ABC-type amino acid transport substrate-binding protein